MLNTDTLKELESLAGFEELVRVVTIQAILHTTKPVIKLDDPGAFDRKCKRKFARLLGEDDLSAQRAMAILMACEEFELKRTLQGLGGCVEVPLEALLDAAGITPIAQTSAKRAGMRP